MNESGFLHLFDAQWVRYAMQYAGCRLGGGQRGVKLRSVEVDALVAAGWRWGRGFKCEKCVGER